MKDYLVRDKKAQNNDTAQASMKPALLYHAWWRASHGKRESKCASLGISSNKTTKVVMGATPS